MSNAHAGYLAAKRWEKQRKEREQAAAENGQVLEPVEELAQRVARERVELAGAAEGYEYLANGQPVEPPEDEDDEDPSTSWKPVDLAPWLRGEIEVPQPAIGIIRSDGQQLIYPGCEHVIIGSTESGKSWMGLGCVAAEISKGNHVVYIHYEEGPGNTIERLRLLGAEADQLIELLHFVSPDRPVRKKWLDDLVDTRPSLVIHDGVNEAMALHGDEISKDPAGPAKFRRRLILPFIRASAASIACDHLPMMTDNTRKDAFGSVHKGNALDGARILLNNTAPFGRGLRGVSQVFVTKDRPGWLRAQGKPTSVPGKTFMGMLVVDDADPFAPLSMMFYAPKDDDNTEQRGPDDELRETIWELVAARPDRMVDSMRKLLAALRATGNGARDTAVRDAVDDLIENGRLTEVPKGAATGYRAESSASQEVSE